MGGRHRLYSQFSYMFEKVKVRTSDRKAAELRLVDPMIKDLEHKGPKTKRWSTTWPQAADEKDPLIKDAAEKVEELFQLFRHRKLHVDVKKLQQVKDGRMAESFCDVLSKNLE